VVEPSDGSLPLGFTLQFVSVPPLQHVFLTAAGPLDEAENEQLRVDRAIGTKASEDVHTFVLNEIFSLAPVDGRNELEVFDELELSLLVHDKLAAVSGQGRHEKLLLLLFDFESGVFLHQL